MALNASRLANAIVATFQSVNPGMTTDQINQIQTSWNAIAADIVNEITGHAEVNPGSFAVSTAPGAVTGTGTVS